MTKYTYPNISFNSKILGPTPATPLWRDGYAIVGEFNRGPRTPTKSSQLSVLTALYGEDKNSGSIALQQAMLQGASNATVVRVVPGSEPSRMVFEVAGDNANIVPRTGYESIIANTQVLDSFNRTTGFDLKLDYVGDATPTSVSHSRVATAHSLVEHPTFNGRAQMEFSVVASKSGSSAEPVVYEDALETLSVSLLNASYGEYQVLSYTEGSNEYVEQYIEPGFSFRVEGQAQTFGLVIASTPFNLNESSGLKGVLVKGAFSPTASHTGVINEVTQTRVLTVDTLLSGSAAFEPTAGQLTILTESAIVVNGQAFTATEVTNNLGTLTITLSKVVNGVAAENMPVTFAPVVHTLALDGADTLVTLKGVLADTVVVGSKLNFSTNLEESYEVTEVTTPYNVATGVVVVKLAGDVRGGVKLRSYALATAASSTPIVAEVKVRFSSRSQNIVGYSFRPVDDSASLSSVDLSQQYFSLPGSIYDSHIVIPEGSGGVPLAFRYQTRPLNLVGAARLGQEPLGIKHTFGFVGDTKTHLVPGFTWFVPFLKATVSVGGAYDSLDAYPAGTQAGVILKDLELAIYSSPSLASMFGEVKVDLTETPYTFTAIPSFEGDEGNRIYWNLVRHVAGPTALFEGHTANVISMDDVPDVLELNPTDYSLSFNGQEYPVTAFDGALNTVTINAGGDDTFLELITPGEAITFVSQVQTRDLMLRVDETGLFSNLNYGDELNFTFKGGRDTSQYAYRDFYSLDGRPLVRVRALSPGLYGNRLKVTILPDEITDDSAKFYLQVEDTDTEVAIGTSKVETFYLDNSAVGVDTGLYLDTRESNLIRAFFLPAAEFRPTPALNALPKSTYQALPLRVAPPLEIFDTAYASGFTRVNSQGAATVKDISLFGGSEFNDTDPPSAVRARVTGYLNALRQLESSDVNWIGVVGINFGDPAYREVFSLLKKIVDEAVPHTGGFRRAVVQLSPSVSPRQAMAYKAQAGSSRFIQIAGVTQGVTTSGIVYQQAPVVGVYIGLGASRPPHISPASIYGGRTPAMVYYSSIVSRPTILEAYTQANTEVFHMDDAVGAYKFLNGLTTNNSHGLRHVSVVHTWDQVRDAIYKALLPYKSSPATPALWARITSACDALMSNFMRDEWLMRYAPTICDERNNSEVDLINGTVNILIRATPSFPADYLKVTDVLDMRASIEFNAQPGQSIGEF